MRKRASLVAIINTKKGKNSFKLSFKLIKVSLEQLRRYSKRIDIARAKLGIARAKLILGSNNYVPAEA
jgi:hypothetical protein